MITKPPSLVCIDSHPQLCLLTFVSFLDWLGDVNPLQNVSLRLEWQELEMDLNIGIKIKDKFVSKQISLFNIYFLKIHKAVSRF